MFGFYPFAGAPFADVGQSLRATKGNKIFRIAALANAEERPVA
jgi:hypothetical protein